MNLPQRVQEILVETAAAHGVRVCEITGHIRSQLVDRARTVAMGRVRDEIKIAGRPVSYPKMGQWFDRDHSTIVEALRRYRAIDPQDQKFLCILPLSQTTDTANQGNIAA